MYNFLFIVIKIKKIIFKSSYQKIYYLFSNYCLVLYFSNTTLSRRSLVCFLFGFQLRVLKTIFNRCYQVFCTSSFILWSQYYMFDKLWEIIYSRYIVSKYRTNIIEESFEYIRFVRFVQIFKILRKKVSIMLNFFFFSCFWICWFRII